MVKHKTILNEEHDKHDFQSTLTVLCNFLPHWHLGMKFNILSFQLRDKRMHLWLISHMWQNTSRVSILKCGKYIHAHREHFQHLPTYRHKTYSKQLGSSQVTSTTSASHEFPHILWILKNHHHAHNSPLLVHILGLINSSTHPLSVFIYDTSQY